VHVVVRREARRTVARGICVAEAARVRILVLLVLAGCMVGDEPIEADGDDGEITAEATGDPHRLNIGFNDGHVDQFGYYADYFDATPYHPGPRLCHAYIAWDVATRPPHSGDVTDPSARAFLDNWLAQAEGHCDDALISFKAHAHGAPPATSTYANAIEKFAAVDWRAEAGFTGTISLTPWNEPNNGADAGDGLGAPIDARVAARYYLAAERACRKHACKVAAGDFASNGDMWNDFEFNCRNDNVAPSDLCKHKSSVNPDGKGASYLDRYKNEIVDRAEEFGLPAGFRPEVFAYHGWHDSNSYLNVASHCSTYGSCVLRRILKSLGGSWGHVVLWNTEDGVGQNVDPGDATQACAAAFMLRLEAITPRVHRLYLTRLHGGGGQLLDGHAPRPALTVFEQRRMQYAASCD
jgi:hypothetical protein